MVLNNPTPIAVLSGEGTQATSRGRQIDLLFYE